MLSKSQPKQDVKDITRRKMLFCKGRECIRVTLEPDFMRLLYSPRKIPCTKNTMKCETDMSRSNSNGAARLDPAKTCYNQAGRKGATNRQVTSASSEKKYGSRPTLIKPPASPTEYLPPRCACPRTVHGQRWPELRGGSSETKASWTMI